MELEQNKLHLNWKKKQTVSILYKCPRARQSFLSFYLDVLCSLTTKKVAVYAFEWLSENNQT